jgi:hypothetical protein
MIQALIAGPLLGFFIVWYFLPGKDEVDTNPFS